MNKKQFKGFEDLVIKDGLWAFKGENVWSKDITKLWKWIQLALKKLNKKNKGLSRWVNVKLDISDFEADD